MEIGRFVMAMSPGFNRLPVFQPVTMRCSISQNISCHSTGGDIFFLGIGFVGHSFAADLKKNGWSISGSCRSIEKKKKLEELGYQAYVFDSKDPQLEVLEILKEHKHLVVSTPPILGLGDPLLQYKELVENILKDGRLEWLAYLSSTSVYGDSGGAWVDEDSPAMPATESARARLAAEGEWLSLGHNLGIATQVFRLGGIYGPGRSAIDTILKKAPFSNSQKTRSSKIYTSRAHVTDICQALSASILKPSPGRIYNIVDDDPAPRERVFELAQKLVEEKFPSFGMVDPSGVESFNTEKRAIKKGEKRVSNARMKKELGVDLLCPTYISGLQSIIDGSNPHHSVLINEVRPSS